MTEVSKMVLLSFSKQNLKRNNKCFGTMALEFEAQEEPAPVLCLHSSCGPVFSVESSLVVVAWCSLVLLFLELLKLAAGLSSVRWHVSESGSSHRRNDPKITATLLGSIRPVSGGVASRIRAGQCPICPGIMLAAPHMFSL